MAGETAANRSEEPAVNWPDWLTEARAAILISLASASFTGLTLVYTRRLAKNDTARMKRKEPIFEIEMSTSSDVPDGWTSLLVTARNLETVSFDLTAISTKRRNQFIIRTSDTYEGNSRNPWIEHKRLEVIPERREVLMGMRVAPAGTPRHPDGITPSAVEHTWLLTKGVNGRGDLVFHWLWSDGKKD
nr:hypothetical protein [Paracoccus saliphilus]